MAKIAGFLVTKNAVFQMAIDIIWLNYKIHFAFIPTSS
jgi:hypothetical protein